MNRQRALLILALCFISQGAFARDGRKAFFTMDGLVDGGMSYSGIEAVRLENVPETVRSKFAGGWNRRTAFAVKSKGGLAERFYMDVDYRKDDGDAGADEDSRILLRYQGREGEILKSLELGDTDLSLPGARWLSPRSRSGKVSRRAFAGKGVLSWRGTDLVLIGAHQKGKPETETFRLESTQRRAEIRDTDYLRRRYYALAPESDLPLDPHSVTLWIDDGNRFNNTQASERFTPAGSAREGDFDALIPNDVSQGYELDPRTGVVRFFFEVPFNAALAVSYKTVSGAWVERRLVKSDDDQTTGELLNRYALPGDFLDLTGTAVEDAAGRQEPVPPYDLDALNKTLIFQSTRPFAAAAYGYPPAHSRTLVLSYLSTGEQTTLTLSKEPIAETVSVNADGRSLQEGTDYTLVAGGGRGVITLHGSRPGQTVTVQYNSKDTPQVRQTAGAGLLFGANAPFSFGLSALYDFAPRPSRAPQLGGDAANLKMIGASLKGSDTFGTNELRLEAEAAASQYNPNPFGASLLDSMDGIRRSLAVELRDTFWKPSSRSPLAVGSRSRSNPAFDSVYLKDILPAVPSDQREQTLALSAGAGEWAGVQRALAPRRGAMDLRAYRHLELFVYSSDALGRLRVEWGDASEDLNGDGKLDTEDANGDGLSDDLEDSGVFLENGLVFGRGDHLSDSEDLDLDGRLSKTESVSSNAVPLTWIGWKKIRLPLNGTSSTRFLRLWVEGPANIRVAKVEFTGLDYTEETSAGSSLTAGSVSNFSDPDAPALLGHPTFNRLYPDRAAERTDRGQFDRARLEDFAVSLDFNLLPGGEVSARRSVRLDLTDQAEIHFFAASTAPCDAALFLRMGSQTDYFEFTTAVSQLSPQYREFSIHRDRFRAVGRPDWADVREIRIGLSNPAASPQSGRVYVNELFVDKPRLREAVAYNTEAEIRRPVRVYNDSAAFLLGDKGHAFASCNVVKVPEDFRAPDETLRGQDHLETSAGWQSDRALLRWTRTEDRQGERANGDAAGRLIHSSLQSDRADWDVKPRLYMGRLTFSGTAERRRRTEPYVLEDQDTLRNRLAYDNDRLSDWAPKTVSVDASAKRDRSLSRRTWGTAAETRWSAFSGDLTLAPRTAFEETILSTSGFLQARSSLVGLGGTATLPVIGREIFLDADGQSENVLQRGGAVALSLSRQARAGANHNGGILGRTALSCNWRERLMVTTGTALNDPGQVWALHASRPRTEPQSVTESREGTAAQENIRILRLVGLPGLDWFGAAVRVQAREERSRYLGTQTQDRAVRFPDASLTFSSGPWTVEGGGWLERQTGTDRSGRIQAWHGRVDGKAGRWEWRNSCTARSETQTRNSAVSLDLRTLTARTTAKWTVGSPQYRTLHFLRRNVLLENRLETSVTVEVEDRRGREAARSLREWTAKTLTRADYFLKKDLKIYATADVWRHVNRLASASNYTAYSVMAGLHMDF